MLLETGLAAVGGLLAVNTNWAGERNKSIGKENGRDFESV